jgi:hypothetical protein
VEVEGHLRARGDGVTWPLVFVCERWGDALVCKRWCDVALVRGEMRWWDCKWVVVLAGELVMWPKGWQWGDVASCVCMREYCDGGGRGR